MVHTLDKCGEVDFAPLQGELSAEKGFTKYADKSGGTMVLLREDDGEVFMKGDAWVELGKVLGGGCSIVATCFAVLPKGLRDFCYDIVAKNRYLLAGKNDSCALAEETLSARIRG